MSKSRWLAGVGLAVMALALTACRSTTSTGEVAGSGSGAITVDVVTVGAVPWLAVQDGAGAWTALSGGSFIVNDSAGRYGVAWVCPSGVSAYALNVVQWTTEDGASVRASCQVEPFGVASVSGTITGIASGGSAYIAIGHARTSLSSTGTAVNFSLPTVETGSHTIVAYGMEPSTSPLASVYVRRDVPIESGGLSGFNVDLADPTFAVTSGLELRSVSVAGVPANETGYAGADYQTRDGFANSLSMASGAPDYYPVIPPALAEPTDRYDLWGHATLRTSTGRDEQLVHFVTRTPDATTSLVLPPPLAGDTGIAVAGGAVTATWGSPTFSTPGGVTAYFGAAHAVSTDWSVTVSSNWLGSEPSYTFPDFTATSGWDSTWDFPSGTRASVDVKAVHANLGLQQLLASLESNIYPDGTTIEVIERSALVN